MVVAAISALAAVALQPATSEAVFQPPPIRHVWIIVEENSSYEKQPPLCCAPLTTPGEAPYLADTLAKKQGLLMTQYWGIGHNSLSNYDAMISGQAPNPDTQGDCLSQTEIPDNAPFDPHHQIIGQGCFFPSTVKTLADQLIAEGMDWGGYMQDFRDETGREGSGCPARERNNPSGVDEYARKHDPFQFFHTIIDDEDYCLSHDVSLAELAEDLQSIRTTPNLSFISPGLFDDGHDSDFTVRPDPFLRQIVPMITSSPAYRQDGLLIITFDESETFIGVPFGPEDDLSCCNEIPGPNSPDPGIIGPGGGRTGAVALSPFIEPGSVSMTPYNHYSLLRSLEDAYGITTGWDDGFGHLGFAGTYAPTYPGPGSFGPDFYTAYDGAPLPGAAAPAPGPAGPRPTDGSAEWQHPLPQGGDLDGLSCPDADTCFAAGDAGTILSTSDGGDSWSVLDTGSAVDLNAISCASPSNCVAVGDGAKALRSSDGGASWSSHDTGASVDLNGVSCPDADTCYAVGAGGAIAKSSDGGQSWNAQDSGVTQILYAVSCPSASDCFAVGDAAKIVATDDGGANWSQQAANPGNNQRLWAVSCPDADTCFAAGDTSMILGTVDGGANWTQKPGGFPDQYRGVSCADQQHCFVAGESGRKQGTFSLDAAAVLGTADGGATNFDRKDTDSDNILHAISCPALDTCFAVGVRGSILRSTDGGASWSKRSPGTESDPSRVICASTIQCIPESVSALEGTSCPNASTCFAVGSYQTIMATTDGGSSWDIQKSGTPQDGAVAPPPLTPRGLNAVSCPNAGTCFAVGDLGTILATTDGGANWSDQDSSTDSNLLGVSCPTASTCFAVGGDARIITTSDGGNDWSRQSSGLGASVRNLLSDVSCASASMCVAVGNRGTVLGTSDGGSTWTLRGSGTDVYLDGVSCPNTSACVAVGSGGTTLRSMDGGQSWTPVGAGVGDDLMTVSCSSAADCMATGSSGSVVSTADGGATWAAQGTGTSRALRDTSCPTADECIAAGDAAAILAIEPTAVPGGGGEPPPGGGGGGGGEPPDQNAPSGEPCGDLQEGTNGADRLRGSDGPDVLRGFDGQDTAKVAKTDSVHGCEHVKQLH